MKTTYNRYAEFEPIADALRKVLDEQGVSVRKLAGLIDKDEETIGRYLRCETVPDIATFRHLLLALPPAARVTVLRAAFHSFGVTIESTEPIKVTITDGPMHYAAEANMEMAEVIFTIQKAMADKSIALSEQLQIQEEIADVVERLDRTQVSMGA
jgi:transcriptional regulator with XRE-family HTH domain